MKSYFRGVDLDNVGWFKSQKSRYAEIGYRFTANFYEVKGNLALFGICESIGGLVLVSECGQCRVELMQRVTINFVVRR